MTEGVSIACKVNAAAVWSSGALDWGAALGRLQAIVAAINAKAVSIDLLERPTANLFPASFHPRGLVFGLLEFERILREAQWIEGVHHHG